MDSATVDVMNSTTVDVVDSTTVDVKYSATDGAERNTIWKSSWERPIGTS